MQLGRKSADGTGLFIFHSMFMNGTVRRADFWFLEYSVFKRTCFEYVYRCSPLMQSHHANRLEKAHESLLRERQISVMLSSLRFWSSEAEIGWHWPMLVFSSVLLTDHGHLLASYYTSLGWSHMLAKISDGEVCFLPLLFPSQGKPTPTVVPPS